MSKFRIGQLLITRGVADKMSVDINLKKFIEASLNRYISCDWGEMSDEDKKSNDDAVSNGEERIMASYTDSVTNMEIWIITECDRSVTTILFPDEY